jgi:RHS repeat-associated protein
LIVSILNDARAVIATNTHDAYGRPGAANQGRFQYTGQAYIASLGHHDCKARFYAPKIGSFLQY